jgi:hypothetical protein
VTIRPTLSQTNLFWLHAVTVCASMACVQWVYTYLEIFPQLSAPDAAKGALVAAGFVLASAPIFWSARFTFGYMVGLYFFTLVLGYLWVALSSRFSYDHNVAAASAFASGVAFLLPALRLSVPMPRLFSPSHSSISKLLVAIPAVALATILVGTLYHFRLATTFSEMYRFREEMRFPLPLAYAIGIFSSSLLPFAFACFFERRQHWRAAVCALLLLAFYPLTLTKMAAFAPIWLLFVAVLSRYFEPRVAAVLSLLLPIGAGLLALAVDISRGSDFYLVFGTINFRMVAIPSLSIDIYSDFFAHRPLTHFCQISYLKAWVNCPYPEQIGVTMANEYHLGNYNGPMFATEGIASVGQFGAPVVALACGVLIAIANGLSSHLPPRFIMLSAGVLLPLLVNVPFTTVLITHGAGLLFVLWYITPKEALGASSEPPSVL